MRILMVDPSQSKLPVPDDLIRADTYISIPLARELIRRGHDVSFLTSNDSSLDIPQIKTKLDAMFSVIPIEQFYALKDSDLKVEFTKSFFADILNACEELAHTKKFDIIHIHSNYYILELSLLESVRNTPIVVTLHSISESRELLDHLASHHNLDNTHFLSISDKQREAFPYRFHATAYNGVDTDTFSFEKTGGEDLLFSGRLRKIKGIIEALETAVRTNTKLRFVGKTSTEESFVKDEVVPYINSHPHLISHVDSINRSNIPSFYQSGKLTLFPILWEEPFGLVQIESMACGTPIVAYARGSVPEVIKDGETGFIVNSSPEDIRGDWVIKKTGIEGLCEAVERIYALPPEEYIHMRMKCRKHVEDNFSIARMVDRYEKIYNDTMGKI